MTVGVVSLALRSDLPSLWGDPLLTFRAHVNDHRVRHSTMGRLARGYWGLETGILCTTHNFLLVSLLRYGLVAEGSGLHAEDFRKLEVRHTDIAARRGLGLGISARQVG